MLIDASHWPYRTRAAHRGAGRLAPENTLAAMRVGAAHGYTMFEFDVKLSGDGVLVLMHDDTVDRTTDGRGRVAGMGLAELAKLDAGRWHSPAWAGEGVPTLARVASFLNASRLQANIEIKPCPGREAETGAAVALEARALWRDAGVPPLLSSFSEAALDAARRAAPELPRALLVGDPGDDWRARCRALGCVALDADHASLTPALVDDVHAAGLRLLCYTANEPVRVTLLAAWGVDCVITDAIDRIAPA